MCRGARLYLMAHHGVQAPGTAGYPLLSHEDHFHGICQYLRSNQQRIWAPQIFPNQLRFTAVVYDRFHRNLLFDADGQSFELPETHAPVRPALNTEVPYIARIAVAMRHQNRPSRMNGCLGVHHKLDHVSIVIMSKRLERIVGTHDRHPSACKLLSNLQ